MICHHNIRRTDAARKSCYCIPVGSQKNRIANVVIYYLKAHKCFKIALQFVPSWPCNSINDMDRLLGMIISSCPMNLRSNFKWSRQSEKHSRRLLRMSSKIITFAVGIKMKLSRNKLRTRLKKKYE